MVTDFDDGTGPDEDLPEPTSKGVLDLPKDSAGKPVADGEDPGAPDAPYSRTGWAPRMGWPVDDAMDGPSLLDHTTWLESKVPDKFYGGKSLSFVSQTAPLLTVKQHRLVP